MRNPCSGSGKPGPSIKLPKITVNPTGTPNGSVAKRFDDTGKLIEFGMTLYGPLEPMLYDQLPCEIAHIMLAAHLSSDVPAWADAGFAVYDHLARAPSPMPTRLSGSS